MIEDAKQIVLRGYGECGGRYNAARSGDPSPELQRLLSVLQGNADSARVLEIGCGGGAPVLQTLARHARVTGVDLSPKQIERARRRVPEAELIAGDIMAQDFEAGSFDAVVSFYTLFHLPRDEHRPLLERVARWLAPGGHLLATVANSNHEGYTEPEFFGVEMYWSHYEAAWYSRAMEELDFEILACGHLDHGYRNVEGVPPERHPVLFARAPVGPRRADDTR